MNEESGGETGWTDERKREGSQKGSGERTVGGGGSCERERDVETPTILINPVPGAQNRSRRSNRVHDLQGIYIRSSTRGYNSIPSLYSALGEPLTGGREGVKGAADPARRIHDAHIILARTLSSVVAVVSLAFSATASPTLSLSR